MSGPERTPKPALAKVSGGRRSHESHKEPFAAYLLAARQDPDAAWGLALAYAELPQSARVELVDAIHTDAIAEGIDAAPLLAGLLGVEQETYVARHIASVMTARPGSALPAATTQRAFLAGDDSGGVAALVFPLHGDLVEVLSLAWTREDGLTAVELEPMLHERKLCALLNRLRERSECALPQATEDSHLERIPLAFAVDLIAPVLWHHRRVHGALPSLLARFADVFDVSPLTARGPAVCYRSGSGSLSGS